MKLRIFAAAALLSSTLASAADAPSQLALAECKLDYVSAYPVLKGMTPFKTDYEGDYDADGYETDIKYYKINVKPFGLTGLELMHSYTDDIDYGEEYDSLEIDVSENFDVAKARMLAAAGAPKCSAEGGVAPNRTCTVPRTGSNLYLKEANGLTYYSCNI